MRAAMSSICRWDRVTGGQGFTSGNALTENQPARLSPRPADYQSVPCPFSMGVSSLMNDIELACLLLPRGKG
jgi:hypothetical protein